MPIIKTTIELTFSEVVEMVEKQILAQYGVKKVLKTLTYDQYVPKNSSDPYMKIEVPDEIEEFHGLTLEDIALKGKKGEITMSNRLINLCKQNGEMNLNEELHQIRIKRNFGKKARRELAEILDKMDFFKDAPNKRKLLTF